MNRSILAIISYSIVIIIINSKIMEVFPTVSIARWIRDKHCSFYPDSPQNTVIGATNA